MKNEFPAQSERTEVVSKDFRTTSAVVITGRLGSAVALKYIFHGSNFLVTSSYQDANIYIYYMNRTLVHQIKIENDYSIHILTQCYKKMSAKHWHGCKIKLDIQQFRNMLSGFYEDVTRKLRGNRSRGI